MSSREEKSKKTDDPYYRGEPTSKRLKEGPLSDRKCTDFFCLIIFIAFWFGTVSIAVFAFTHGDPVKMTRPFDRHGHQCGVDYTSMNVTEKTSTGEFIFKEDDTGKDSSKEDSTGDSDSEEDNTKYNLTEYKYLLFIQEDSDFNESNTICVKTCPTNNAITTDYTGGKLANYPTVSFAERFCIPSLSNATAKFSESEALETGLFFTATNDLIITWWMILVVGAFALILGFLYLIFMKYFAGVFLWGVLISFIVLTAGFGTLCLAEAMGTIDVTALTPDDLSTFSPGVLKLIAGVSYLISLIAFIITCMCRSRINLSIAVLKCATNFIEDTKTILIVPFVFFIKSMVFYVGWVVIFVYIVGTNELSFDEEERGPIGDIEWTSESFGMMAYYVFALFWCHTFSVALSQFIIASAACLWYFKQSKSNLCKHPVWTSVKRSILHLGSIAFGSLLVAFLDIIRVVLKYLSEKLNKAPQGGEEEGPGFCVACCGCCVGFFEKFLKFVNRHAYIQIAMTGESFCQATQDAFHLLLRNAVRFGMVHGLANTFLFFGQLLVALTATLLGYLIITNIEYFEDDLVSPVTPSIFFFLSSYMIAHIFLSVYGVSADTVIHCFAMDEEINDGPALHAPKELREFVDDHLHKKLLSDDSLRDTNEERLL